MSSNLGTVTRTGIFSHIMPQVENDYVVGTQLSTSWLTRERDGWILLAIENQGKAKKNCSAFLLCDPGCCVYILTERCSLTSRINGMTTNKQKQKSVHDNAASTFDLAEQNKGFDVESFCCCLLSSHLFWTSDYTFRLISYVNAPAGVTLFFTFLLRCLP